MSEPNPSVTCPKCHEAFAIDIVAKFRDCTRTAVTIKKKSGQSFTADDIACVLTNYSKLLKAIGREMGAKLLVTIPEIALTGDELTMTFMASRIVKGDA